MIDTLYEYYKALAEKSCHICDFVGSNDNELLDRMGEGSLNFPCLVQDTVTGRLGGVDRDHPFVAAQGGFAILDKISQSDYAGERAALDKALAIGGKVLARMKRDQLCGRIPGVVELDLDEVKWEQLEVGDNLVGILFHVPLYHAWEMGTNPDDWEEYDE